MAEDKIDKSIFLLKEIKEIMIKSKNYVFIRNISNIIFELSHKNLKNALSLWISLNSGTMGSFSEWSIQTVNKEGYISINQDVCRKIEYLQQFFEELFNEFRIIEIY